MPKSVRGVMDEFKRGVLHSGSSTGKKVTNRKQAIAIALSEQRERVSGAASARYHLSAPRKAAMPKKRRG